MKRKQQIDVKLSQIPHEHLCEGAELGNSFSLLLLITFKMEGKGHGIEYFVCLCGPHFSHEFYDLKLGHFLEGERKEKERRGSNCGTPLVWRAKVLIESDALGLFCFSKNEPGSQLLICCTQMGSYNSDIPDCSFCKANFVLTKWSYLNSSFARFEMVYFLQSPLLSFWDPCMPIYFFFLHDLPPYPAFPAIPLLLIIISFILSRYHLTSSINSEWLWSMDTDMGYGYHTIQVQWWD